MYLLITINTYLPHILFILIFLFPTFYFLLSSFSFSCFSFSLKILNLFYVLKLFLKENFILFLYLNWLL